MASISMRNLLDETYRALKLRATMAGRSTEAEIRLILNQTIQPKQPVKLGSLLTQIGQEIGGVDLGNLRESNTDAKTSF
jgi:hypothetical protein